MIRSALRSAVVFVTLSGTLVGVAALAFTSAACGNDSDSGSSNTDKPECAKYADYKVDKKATVSIYATIRDVEADKLEQKKLLRATFDVR